jgi:hypothetical protein
MSANYLSWLTGSDLGGITVCSLDGKKKGVTASIYGSRYKTQDAQLEDRLFSHTEIDKNANCKA